MGRHGIHFGHGSSPGRVRETNEDYHRVKSFATPRGPLVFLAVADGMGGASAGEHASKLAVETVTEGLARYAEYLCAGRPAVGLARALEKAMLAANLKVHKAGLASLGRSGMGTTLTVAVISGLDLVLGHVGDSRAYLARDGELRQLTSDHSWVAEQVGKGLLSREAAAGHEYRNLLVKALGTRATLEPEIKTLSLLPGDALLLSSDGLHGLVAEGELLGELRRGAALQSAVDYWIGLALHRGGPDNITGVLARVEA